MILPSSGAAEGLVDEKAGGVVGAVCRVVATRAECLWGLRAVCSQKQSSDVC